MAYYEILPAGNNFHGKEALTYHSAADLPAGSVVRVPLRRGSALGIVLKQVAKPAFSTKAISQIFDLPPLPPSSLQLLSWLQTFYPSPFGAIVQLFLPKSLLIKPDITPVRSMIKQSKMKLPKLTEEQQKALNTIIGPGTYLLHGETGSGKTRVYLELTKQMLKAGRSAIILTPEIGLTSQLEATFQAEFPGQVLVVHSELGEKERRSLWLLCLTSERPLVIIGPRSALFSPLAKIGLIVLDESHDSAYKQEQQPHYQAQRLASKLRQLDDAVLVLGSATPSVDDYFLAEQKQIPIVRMRHAALTTTPSKPDIKVIDLKDRTHFSRVAHLSNELLAAIETSLKAGEQSLLFLNRRGTARIVLCQVCGWQALCPNCDLPLAYHSDFQSLRCHTCGHREPLILNCPVCGSPELRFKAIGTKAVEEELRRLLPKARIQRFDTDVTRLERLNHSFGLIQKGEVDILIGTQILAKGLDLPKLSVVGVICADTSLYLPDFSAQERTYQLIYQVVGRVGRGHRAGRAIIQTYQPHNPVLNAALDRDWSRFYQLELKERATFLFPPFCALLKLTTRRANRAAAQKAAEDLAKHLRSCSLKVEIIGPTPSFHEKIAGRYQWQLVAKARNRSELLKIIPLLPAAWTYDLDPVDLL